MNEIEKVISIAKEQIGNGAKKYREWYYGYNATGVAWCAVFVSWLFSQEGVKMVKTDGAGCFAREGNGTYGKWYKRTETTPQKGDIITFRWGGSYTDQYHSDHVGIVYYTDSNNVYTIEGNTGGSNDTSEVSYRMYNKSDSRINGYFRPFYSDKKESDDTMEIQKGDKNEFVSAYKALLQQAYVFGLVSVKVDDTNSFGDGTYKATVEIQKLYNLDVDGIAGKDTIKALKTALLNKVEVSKKGHNALVDDLVKSLENMKV